MVSETFEQEVRRVSLGVQEEEKRRRADAHFAKIAIKPLEIPRACLGEAIEFLVEALEILDVSYTLREVIEEWCDKHDA